MHNYFTNYHNSTRFDTIVSSSGSLKSLPWQVTQVFQMQLLVIQLKIKMFHISFMQNNRTTASLTDISVKNALTPSTTDGTEQTRKRTGPKNKKQKRAKSIKQK